MKRLMMAVAGLAACAQLAFAGDTPPTRTGMSYPKTRSDDVKDVLFGVTVPDPYRWLEEAKRPEVQKWMGEQDKLARDYLAKLPARDALARRLKSLYYVDSISAPIRRGKRFFYTRTHADKEKAIH